MATNDMQFVMSPRLNAISKCNMNETLIIFDMNFKQSWPCNNDSLNVYLKFGTLCIYKLNYFEVLCNISFKWHFPEDGHKGWQKHVAGYAVYNKINLHSWTKTNLMSLAFLLHYLMLNIFRMLIHPSSGACDLFVELFHGLYCSGSMCVGVTLWFGWGGVVSGCRLKQCFSLHVRAVNRDRYWRGNISGTDGQIRERGTTLATISSESWTAVWQQSVEWFSTFEKANFRGVPYSLAPV